MGAPKQRHRTLHLLAFTGWQHVDAIDRAVCRHRRAGKFHHCGEDVRTDDWDIADCAGLNLAGPADNAWHPNSSFVAVSFPASQTAG